MQARYSAAEAQEEIKKRVAELKAGPGQIDESSLKVELESLGPLEFFLSTCCSMLSCLMLPIFCMMCIKEVSQRQVMIFESFGKIIY